MKKRISRVRTGKGETQHRSAALALISAAFLLGGVLGFLVQKEFSASSYIQLFLQDSISGPSVGQELWWVFRWPVGLILLQLLPLAGFTIPAAICLRGFLLSYSISAFVQVQIKTAILLFGPTCAFTLPVLFLLSTAILLRKAGERYEQKPVALLACLLSLLLCIMIDLTVVPMLLA